VEPEEVEEIQPAMDEHFADPVLVMDARDEDLIGTDHSGRSPAPLSNPMSPSAFEVEEHNRTHLPYRSWCQHCVRGWGQSRDHRKLNSAKERIIPQVVMDYCFLGAEGDESTAPLLVVKDTSTRRIITIPVPSKGVSSDFPVRQLHNSLCLLGHRKIILNRRGTSICCSFQCSERKVQSSRHHPREFSDRGFSFQR
jgi:hypothetical protein